MNIKKVIQKLLAPNQRPITPQKTPETKTSQANETRKPTTQKLNAKTIDPQTPDQVKNILQEISVKSSADLSKLEDDKHYSGEGDSYVVKKGNDLLYTVRDEGRFGSVFDDSKWIALTQDNKAVEFDNSNAISLGWGSQSYGHFAKSEKDVNGNPIVFTNKTIERNGQNKNILVEAKPDDQGILSLGGIGLSTGAEAIQAAFGPNGQLEKVTVDEQGNLFWGKSPIAFNVKENGDRKLTLFDPSQTSIFSMNEDIENLGYTDDFIALFSQDAEKLLGLIIPHNSNLKLADIKPEQLSKEALENTQSSYETELMLYS